MDSAKKAWEDFLKRDSTSAWADEARQHLEELPRERSSPRSKRTAPALAPPSPRGRRRDRLAWPTSPRRPAARLLPERTARRLGRRSPEGPADAAALRDAAQHGRRSPLARDRRRPAEGRGPVRCRDRPRLPRAIRRAPGPGPPGPPGGATPPRSPGEPSLRRSLAESRRLLEAGGSPCAALGARAVRGRLSLRRWPDHQRPAELAQIEIDGAPGRLYPSSWDARRWMTGAPPRREPVISARALEPAIEGARDLLARSRMHESGAGNARSRSSLDPADGRRRSRAPGVSACGPSLMLDDLATRGPPPSWTSALACLAEQTPAGAGSSDRFDDALVGVHQAR